MVTEIRQGTAADVPTKPVVESNTEFREGVCSGYLTYYEEYQGKPLTDADVYNFLVQNMMDVRSTDHFNAGYCTGWIEALIEDRRILYSPTDRR